MDKPYQFLRRLVLLLRRPQLDRDLQEEMGQHLQMKIEENLADGMTPDEARYAARRSFGNELLLRERSADAWGWRWLDVLTQDLRYGLRVLRKNAVFSAVAIVVLALGIGGNTAVFSVVNTVLLRPLPFDEPEQLVTLTESNPQQHVARIEVAYPTFLDWREQSRSFQQMAGGVSTTPTLRTSQGPVRLAGAFASAGFFELLRVAPALGRTFGATEDKPGALKVAVISQRLWVQRLGSDPSVLGKNITVDDESYSVIGVMPPGFSFPGEDTDIWMPLGLLADQPFMTRRDVHVLWVLGRLKPEITAVQARTEIAGIAARIQPGHSATLAGLHEDLVKGNRRALLLALAAVAVVLLIATANVANLLLVRAAARHREIAVRIALGAGRARVVRQLLTESMLLSLLGGASGLLLAYLALSSTSVHLVRFVPQAAQASLDTRVLLFTLLISALSGLLFGLAPALQAARHDVNDKLKESSAKSTGSNRQRLGRALAAVEVGLTLVLLVGAGLLLKSLWRVLQIDPGFLPQRLLTLTVDLPQAKYRDAQGVIGFYRDLPSHLQALPGVEGVSAVSNLPVSGGDGVGTVTVEGETFDPDGPAASFRRLLPNYFQVMRIPLLRGREFEAHDDGRQMVVILNERMARHFWPNQDPIGRRIKVGPPEGEPWLTVVGVVADVKNIGLDSDPGYATYEPHAQRPRSQMRLVVRTSGDPAQLAFATAAAVRAVDRDVLITDVESMEQRISRSVTPRRFVALLLGSFAALALVLASVGIYGVIAYRVALRTQEIGVRMALGAAPRDVLALVLGDGLKLVGLGTFIGLGGSLAAARAVSSLLFQVGAYDLGTFMTVTALLTATALLATYIPARRAIKVDPTVALRAE